MGRSILIAIPVYQEFLTKVEWYAMERSLSVLDGRDVRLLAPEGLQCDEYLSRHPNLVVDYFAPPTFASVIEYSRLLLSESFYGRYQAWDFMMILQTDAILLRDDLDYWCSCPFDYIGAPWPKPFELLVNSGRFEGEFGRHIRATVGNGGLSLRRIKKCAALLREFAVESALFRETGSSEDLFFATMGLLSNDFILPNEVTASRFAMEGLPRYYQKINGGYLPMGAHAWMKNDPEFWRSVLGDVPAAIT